MSNWYENAAPENDIAISTRIRLARNIKGIPFPKNLDDKDRINLFKTIGEAISKSNTPYAKSLKYISVDDIPEAELFSMVERHLISPEFAAQNNARAIILSDDESICIMLGEEDHIRIQVILGGLQLETAYNTASEIDSLMSSSLDFAFDDELGFLTECPTNLGTGLRASVMLHLPVTESVGEIPAVTDSVGKIGFMVRGMYGEGSGAEASLYQISNQITLGISEKSAIDNLKIITTQLIEKERSRRNSANKLKLEDLCFRALGLLQNSRILSASEMINLLSRIKLGSSMGILSLNVSPVKLLVEGQTNMLIRRFGPMNPSETDIYRATMLREALE